jgi:hypothetical protein
MIRSSSLFVIPVSFFLWFSEALYAFPELTREGYQHCNSCHASPNGGGLLTPYGRGLSKDLLSTWGTDAEVPFMYFLTGPEWLNMGGDVRVIETIVDTPQFEQAQSILMQADVEAGVTYDRFQLVAALGKQSPVSVNGDSAWLYSREHYLRFAPTETVWLRLGRFNKAYGLNIPDHFTVIKKYLGWDENSETYNLELSWLREDGKEVFVTTSIGRPDNPQLNLENGVAVRYAQEVVPGARAGLSYFYGQNTLQNRHVFGPYAIVGFLKYFYVMGELDFEYVTPNGQSSNWGTVDYVKFDFQPVQGLHFNVTQEFAKTNFSDPTTLVNAYGIGAQWFPRPHFEFDIVYQWRRELAQSSDYFNMALFLVHFYL